MMTDYLEAAKKCQWHIQDPFDIQRFFWENSLSLITEDLRPTVVARLNSRFFRHLGRREEISMHLYQWAAKLATAQDEKDFLLATSHDEQEHACLFDHILAAATDRKVRLGTPPVEIRETRQGYFTNGYAVSLIHFYIAEICFLNILAVLRKYTQDPDKHALLSTLMAEEAQHTGDFVRYTQRHRDELERFGRENILALITDHIWEYLYINYVDEYGASCGVLEDDFLSACNASPLMVEYRQKSLQKILNFYKIIFPDADLTAIYKKFA